MAVEPPWVLEPLVELVEDEPLFVPLCDEFPGTGTGTAELFGFDAVDFLVVCDVV